MSLNPWLWSWLLLSGSRYVSRYCASSAVAFCPFMYIYVNHRPTFSWDRFLDTVFYVGTTFWRVFLSFVALNLIHIYFAKERHIYFTLLSVIANGKMSWLCPPLLSYLQEVLSYYMYMSRHAIALQVQKSGLYLFDLCNTYLLLPILKSDGENDFTMLYKI